MSIIHLAKQLVAISESEENAGVFVQGIDISVGDIEVDKNDLRDLAIIGAHHLTQKMKRHKSWMS